MKRILLIEDDEVVANVYRSRFAVEGFHVEVAGDGGVGLEMIQSFQPDAVILDLMLPKIAGLDVIKRIRSEPDTQALPLIVFSNTYLSSLVQEAWKAGATKCLSKATCTPRQMISLVRSVLAPEGTGKTAMPQAGAIVPPTTTASTGALGDGTEADLEFQTELRQTFVESLPTTLGKLRACLQAVVKADSEVSRLKLVHELYRRVHALTSNAGLAGLSQIAQMADALEALLKEVYEKPRNINASTLRTVALAVDFVGLLFEPSRLVSAGQIPSASILVVDDEAISRRAVTFALEKANLKSVGVDGPLVALSLLTDNPFDLIILDVDMPGMTGFELCTKLRSIDQHRGTPVIFVTNLNDFESRASSMMSGGNDFIAKPFLFVELAVKALMYVLRGRLEVEKV